VAAGKLYHAHHGRAAGSEGARQGTPAAMPAAAAVALRDRTPFRRTNIGEPQGAALEDEAADLLLSDAPSFGTAASLLER